MMKKFSLGRKLEYSNRLTGIVDIGIVKGRLHRSDGTFKIAIYWKSLNTIGEYDYPSDISFLDNLMPVSIMSKSNPNRTFVTFIERRNHEKKS